MRPPHRILNRNQVHRLAAEHLQAHLKFKDYKRKTSAQVLWSLLLAAAARITSLSDACQRLRDAPSDETVRKALLATLPDYAVLQRQLNAALAGHLPRALRKHPQRLAIDLTLIPYHGQPFPRLRHRLHHPQGAAVQRGPDRGHEGRGAQGRGPTPAPSGRQRGHPGPAAPAGSWVLQRGGGPLPSSGAGPVPDAGCLPRPVPQAAWRPDRQLRVPDLDDERLVHPYPDRCEEADRDGVDLGEVPQLPGSVEAARAAGPDLRLLGLSAEIAGVGLRDLPAAVRDRVELPSDARGADPDLEPSSRGAAVVRGDRPGAAEPLGVAALRAPVAAVSWRPGDPAGAAAMGDAAAVAAPHGRGSARGRRRHLHRKGCRI